jgi:hypothetical protein
MNRKTHEHSMRLKKGADETEKNASDQEESDEGE